MSPNSGFPMRKKLLTIGTGISPLCLERKSLQLQLVDLILASGSANATQEPERNGVSNTTNVKTKVSEKISAAECYKQSKTKMTLY